MTKRLKNNYDYATIAQALWDHDDFTNPGKTFWGSTTYYGSGRYNDNDMPIVTIADYYIYSYATPIAWFVNGKWFTPRVKYSRTTTNHQSIVDTVLCRESLR